MKYLVFLFGLWLACNESFDLEWSMIGLGLMGAAGLQIIERIKAMKAQ